MDAEKEEDLSGMLIRQRSWTMAQAEQDTGLVLWNSWRSRYLKVERTPTATIESFFYVFPWVIIRYGQGTDNDVPTKSRLQGWYTGTYDEIARNKTGDMDKRGFKNITAEFPPQFEGVKHLAKELRHVLFPIRDEVLFIGTYGEPKWVNIRYNDMVNAFDSAIETYRQ